MALTKAGKVEIAAIINSLQVAEGFIVEARLNNNTESLRVWLNARARAILEIEKEFGVQLPGLEWAQIRMKDQL